MTHADAAAAYRQMIPVDRLRPNDDNPRQDPGQLSDLDLKELRIPELKRSIQAAGLKQWLLVYPDPQVPDHWVIEDGWRRWLAMRDWKTEIPCVIQPPLSGENQHVRNIITALATGENKLDLNPMQKAFGLANLRELLQEGQAAPVTQQQVADAAGLSLSNVSNLLSLLELSVDTQRRVAKREISVVDAMRAIRRQRRRKRKNKGGTGDMGARWQPDWFAKTHQMAYPARNLCNSLEHNSRRRLGASAGYEGACGECWQNVVEQAYEKVLLAAGWKRPE